MSYRIRGLSGAQFQKYFGLPDADLRAHGVYRYRVDSPHGFPDRVEMRDMAPGETALLLNHEHLAIASPYRARHAIFVREGAVQPYSETGIVPDVLQRRLIAVRAYDSNGFMLDADIAEGDAIEPLILRLLGNENAAFLHAHNAKRGCYAGLIERA